MWPDTETQVFFGNPTGWENPAYGNGPNWGNWRGSLALRRHLTRQTGAIVTNFAGRVMPQLSHSTPFDPVTGIDADLVNTLKPTEGRPWEDGVKSQPAAFDDLVITAVCDPRQDGLTRNVDPGVRRQIGEVTSRCFELEAWTVPTRSRFWRLSAACAMKHGRSAVAVLHKADMATRFCDHMVASKGAV